MMNILRVYAGLALALLLVGAFPASGEAGAIAMINRLPRYLNIRPRLGRGRSPATRSGRPGASHELRPPGIALALARSWCRCCSGRSGAAGGGGSAGSRLPSAAGRRETERRESSASIACLIIAMAQPRWGNLPSPDLPPGHDLVFVMDVSRSMAAEDAVPSRLAVAVEVAESLVKTLGQDVSNRAAVVAFAGRGVLRCPLTENLGAVLDALDRLRPGSVTPGGTDLAAALDTAIEAVAIDPQQHAQGRAIVIFSDGEDHADRWSSRLERLRQQDIVVHAVSIGDADGRPSRTDRQDRRTADVRGTEGALQKRLIPPWIRSHAVRAVRS